MFHYVYAVLVDSCTDIVSDEAFFIYSFYNLELGNEQFRLCS